MKPGLKLVLTLLSMVVLLAIIWIFGPMSSRFADKKYRQGIDKNGVSARGIITNKKEKKGREIHFRYVYNGEEFSNYEDSQFYYEMEIGDSVLLQVDSTDPDDSYILGRW